MKEQAEGKKRACAGSLDMVDSPKMAQTCILRAFLLADAILSFSRVTVRSDNLTQLLIANNCPVSSFFLSLECRFFQAQYTTVITFCMERAVCVCFLPGGV